MFSSLKKALCKRRTPGINKRLKFKTSYGCYAENGLKQIIEFKKIKDNVVKNNEPKQTKSIKNNFDLRINKP